MPGPMTLPSNQPAARFYAGGRRISDFRGEAAAAANTPEDWVASTTSVRGQSPVGMSRLPNGTMLADAIAAAPLDWLGPEHVAKHGPDAMLLVKLLDAGQRLPIHAHPDGAFAARHVSAAHGKAEAWHLLTPGTVWLGLTEDIAPDELLHLVETQDVGTLLGLMHRVEVAAHDTVYVPPGVLHAIGEGILLVEVQEPEDLSILLEWTGFNLDGAADGHLGLGFELALQGVELRGRGEVASLVGPGLPPEAEQYFRLDRVSGGAHLDAGFAVLVGTAGRLTLTTGGTTTPVPAGATVLVPFAAGPMRLDGDGEALVARPPL